MKRYLFIICILAGCSNHVEVWEGSPSGHYREITIDGEDYFQIKRPGEDWVTVGKFIGKSPRQERQEQLEGKR